MKKKIGIIGSGGVGKTLGSGFLQHGYEVKIGSRDISRLAEWKAKSGGHTGSFEEAAAFGDILVLAVKGAAAKDALQMAGIENIKNKTVIDTTNPISESPPDKGVIKFFTTLDNSLMEQLQKDFPQSHFVKAFNSIGGALMVNPDFQDSKPTMFFCGNNNQAKKEVAEILDLFGFEPADMGGAEAARAIEPLCILWCIPGFLSNEWTHAFKLLRKSKT